MGFQALLTEQTDAGFHSRVVTRELDDLPAGDVLIRVRYSSVNYKDALSASGNKGVTRNYPHTPGIDAAGEVEDSRADGFSKGDQVLVMGYDLGMNTTGGYGEYIRVPADWVLRLPVGLDARSAMIYGTAGFTAALCVSSLLDVGIRPAQGRVLVTGASGGVGSVAVALLAQQGFEVVAATGKATAHEWLKQLGASDFMGRDALLADLKKPMHKPAWAAAVDTLGGEPLANLLKSIQYGGSVACCGLAASADLPASVLPFILRGINLLGVDSVELPREIKQQIWDDLGADWKLPNLEQLLTHTLTLADLPTYLADLLAGKTQGRAIVQLP